MTVIAMTREMGTRGKEVAALVSDRLGSSLIYHELINDPPDPAELGGPSEVRRHLESGDAAHRPAATPRPNGRMTPVELLEVASRGNVIIRGWGAVRLLHRVPHVLCLRVCAPLEARIAEMVRRLGVSERAARREIEHNDAAHSGVFQRFFSGDWRESTKFDLVLNTARMSPAQCADIVVYVIGREIFAETEASRQALADQLTEARIASYLANNPSTRRAARNVYVSVSGGTVTLWGSVRSEGTAREIGDAVRAHAGADAVRNEIQRTGPYGNA